MAVKNHAMTIRLDPDRYEWLRTAAFERRTSRQRLIEDALDLLRHTPAWLDGTEDPEDQP